jgi:very-short-patch-repair endonuclease
MTEAERRMWKLLRRKSVAGFRFRRQQPIGPFIVDFFCAARKLIVELDGGQHADERADYDARRTAWLESEGYSVVRFWNVEVMENGEGVLRVIGERLGVTYE